ncbi:MAG: GIY-YIG nuclease family protein [Fibrobacterota bacterium]
MAPPFTQSTFHAPPERLFFPHPERSRGVRSVIGYMYILECVDGTYYTGSTVDLDRRLWQHNNFEGANYTKRKHPVKLVYFEEYPRIDEAYYREKQIQGWSHSKKKALIENMTDDMKALAECRNESHCMNVSPLLLTSYGFIQCGPFGEPLLNDSSDRSPRLRSGSGLDCSSSNDGSSDSLSPPLTHPPSDCSSRTPSGVEGSGH